MLGGAVSVGGDHYWRDLNNSWSPTAAPFTLIAAGSRSTSAAGALVLASLDRGGTANHVYSLQTTNTEDVLLYTGAGGAETTRTHNSGAVEGSWYFWGASLDASDNWAIWSNGSETTGNSAYTAPTSIDSFCVGVQKQTDSPHLGEFLYAGVYNVALNAAERAALGAGVHPFLVRPDALLSLVVFVGTTAIDVMGTSTLAETAGTISAVSSGLAVTMQPQGKILSFPVAAVGGVSREPPLGAAVIAGQTFTQGHSILVPTL